MNAAELVIRLAVGRPHLDGRAGERLGEKDLRMVDVPPGAVLRTI